ncbi:hypothetical protein [Paenibacillus macerans]|uniref:hypothetical protein n=1 Tax=Paenibacillus macerans TaxID=44252 RepID=UPI002041C932|nr:hypothetical protein [Paenibacillus macerans]MCM3701204.1 hypothetical protein [Paenibacillus macerans]
MNKKNNLTEFSKTIELLGNTEQGSDTSKARIYNRLIYKLDQGTIEPQSREKDGITMKKSSWRTAAVIGGAVICLGGAFSTTSYAQEMFQSIMAKFKVGNLEITQYDKEIPPASTSFTPSEDGKGERDGVIELPASAKLTIDDARSALGMNFPAPGWVADYKFENSILQGTSMVELQYNSGDKAVNFLISKGGENGIGTTEEVKTEVINGATVYFANGIVIWEEKGFTVELYSQTDFDKATLGKIIDSFSVGAPVEPLEADVMKKNVEKSRAGAAGPAPAED